MKVILVRSRAIDPAVHKVAKTLSKNGYHVKLLLWDRKGDFETEKNLEYEIIKFRLKAPYDKPTVFFYLPIWWIYEFIFLMIENAKIIHSFDFDTLIPILIVKLINRNKIFYTIYDFYADNLPYKVPKFFRKIVAYLEKKSISFCEALFLVDKSRYKQVAGAKIKDIKYIYNSPPDYKGFLKNKKGKRNFTIFYGGIIHMSRGLNFVIDAIKNISQINFIIAGTGPEEVYLKKTYAGFENIKFKGQISYEDVLIESFNADIIIAFYDPNLPNNKFASPNKLFEAMMCSKPIIINSEIAASKIVREEACGLLVDYGDVENLRDVLIKLKNNSQLCINMGLNGRKAYETTYGWPIMEKRLLSAYEPGDNIV